MPKTPPPVFAHLTASKHADSIYYADLFRINGKVWALMGHGKSRAGMAATASRSEDDLARDSVAFIRDGSALLGRYDMGAVGQTTDTYAIAAVAYCLDPQETAKVYGNDPLQLREAAPEIIGGLLPNRHYPAALVDHFFDAGEVTFLRDGLRRYKRWNALTEGVVGTRWFLVPFMPSEDAKGALYAQQQL